MKTQICKWICRLRLFVMPEMVMPEMVMPKSGRHKAENTKRKAKSAGLHGTRRVEE